MTPNEVAQTLRRIASAIDNSKKPDRVLVARDLRALLTRIAEEQSGASAVQQEMHHSQQQQEAIPQSGVGKKMLSEALQAAQEALNKGDEAGLKKAIENVNRAHK